MEADSTKDPQEDVTLEILERFVADGPTVWLQHKILNDSAIAQKPAVFHCNSRQFHIKLF